jgi:carbamoyl-phosphate synthase large subunit
VLRRVEVSTVPAAGEARFPSELRELARRTASTLLVPTVSEELPVLSAGAVDFAPRVDVVVAARGPVVLAHDKLLTAAALARAGVGVPRFAPPDRFAGAADAIDHFGGPVIVKPRVGRGARGVRAVLRASDLDWSTVGPDDLVQEFAPGREFCAVVWSPRSQVEAAVAVVFEKVALSGGLVGNATAVRRLTDGEADPVRRVATDAVQALGLTGPVDIDVRLLESGRPVVLEVNARFGAHSASVPELIDALLAEHAGAATEHTEADRHSSPVRLV